jgi:hypothetical protein
MIGAEALRGIGVHRMMFEQASIFYRDRQGQA